MNLYGTWMCLYMLFSNKFVQLNSELSNSTKTFYDRSIDELIENQSTVDRISELNQIIDRGLEKLNKDEDKSRFRESSPLKAIRSLLKVRKYRPEWTMNPGVYER
jgi:UV DNA damage repair endonuclease